MKTFITTLVITFFGALTMVNAADFRKSDWGMTQEQVKNTETLEISSSTNKGLWYESKLLDKKVMVCYKFIDNKLVSGAYLLEEENTNNNLFIDDYNNFKEALTKKYGEPEKDITHWDRNLFKDMPSHWGTAIALGQLRYIAYWKTQDTEIMVMLHGDAFEIDCSILYSSIHPQKMTEAELDAL